jgi:HD-GYP domain-containing protein (c-di-GMP phosphodiesterase class II)
LSHPELPFVICSTENEASLKKNFPEARGYIEKPKIIGPVVEVVDSIINQYRKSPAFVPIRISSLQRWGQTDFDLFMRLSETKFIKVINAGEAFISADAERFFAKGLYYLHISSEDADVYLKNLEKNLEMVSSSQEIESTEANSLTLESLDSISQIAFSLGWTPAVVEAAKQAMNLAVKAVSKDPSILKLLKQKLSSPSSTFTHHVGKLALLTCGFCYQLGWTSDSTQMKLGMAALMHDITLDEGIYDDIHRWNASGSDFNDKSTETIKYRNHPADAANLLLSLKNLPPDIDQIILQHHENKEGKGFPRGLTSSRISPLACVFILVEDLINFIGESEDFEGKITAYLDQKASAYNSGNFKKVFEALRESVAKAKSQK